jgi:hypothetical protein
MTNTFTAGTLLVFHDNSFAGLVEETFTMSQVRELRSLRCVATMSLRSVVIDLNKPGDWIVVVPDPL